MEFRNESQMSDFQKGVAKLFYSIASVYLEGQINMKINDRVTRGRNRSVASEFEDLFATFISEFLPNTYKVLVDYPISYDPEGGSRRKTIYPDITIVKDNVVVGVVELKVDVGYASDGWEKKARESVGELKRGKNIKYNIKNRGKSHEEMELQISESPEIICVVLSRKNHSERLKASNKNKDMFVLVNNLHPNDHFITSETISQHVRSIENEVNLKVWSELEDRIANFK